MGISLADSASALRINEIMYDPQYEWSFNEWIELYNDEPNAVDLSNHSLCGKTLLAGYVDRAGVTHEESGLVLQPGAYALITDGGSGTDVYENYDAGSSLALHVDASTLCGGLSNGGETLDIEQGNETIEEVSYAPDAEPGFSLEYDEGSFRPSALIDGTPGRENSQGEPPNQNNSEPDPPANETIPPEEEEEPRNRTRAPRAASPSFIPLEDASTPDTPLPEKREKQKITLAPARESPREPLTYQTSEGRTRQIVIYAFAGFCIALTLLIVLKKV